MTSGVGASESLFLQRFRAIFEEANRAWNEGDYRRAYGGLPEDFEYDLAPHWPEARRLRGPDEIASFFENAHEVFPDMQGELGRAFIEVDERTIVVGFDWVGTGAGSGVVSRMEIWQVWEFSEAMVPVRVKEHSDRASALAAAGAPELAEREA